MSTSARIEDELRRLKERVRELEESEAALVRANRELQAAVESRERNGADGLTTLIEAIPHPLFIKDESGRVVACNKALAAFLGRSREELAGAELLPFFTNEFAWHDSKTDRQLQHVAGPVSFEARARRADGALRVLSVKKCRAPRGEGEPRLVIGAVLDVTQEVAIRDELQLQATMLEEEIGHHQRAEEALRERERMLSLIIDTVPQAVYWKDTRSVYLGCNQKFADHAGLPSPADVVGRTDLDLRWGDTFALQYRRNDREIMARDIPKIHQEKLQVEPDGTTTIFDTTKIPLHDACDCVVGVLGVYEDITERKKVEQELRESEERLRLIFEASQFGIVLVSTEGKIVFGNKRLAEMFGCDLDEMLGTRYIDWLYPIASDEAIEATDDMIAGRISSVAAERRYIRKDGSDFYGFISSRRMVEPDGTLQSLVGCIADMTDQKAMEEELFKARKLESLGILAGGIAHDFNNLLTGIMGNVSLARAILPQDHKATQYLERAQHASERARELTQQLLTFSKGGAPVKQLTSLGSIIRDSATFALLGSNVRCTFDISDDLWPAEIDAGQISQVISNLVINADQAMPSGGLLVIRAENVLPLDTEPTDKKIRITLKDNGVGISEENRQRIFDPYFTTKGSGSGLGLATVYSIVKNHDGELKVYSREHHGTTFAITLPAREGEVSSPPQASEVEVDSYGRVLVMDDDAAIRELARNLLEFLGYEPTVCSDGREMLELYCSAADEGNPYSAVIMDLTVPGGMGGKEAVGRLLQLDPCAVAIASSGYSDDAIMSTHSEFGFAGVISKPYSIHNLKSSLASILKASRG